MIKSENEDIPKAKIDYANGSPHIKKTFKKQTMSFGDPPPPLMGKKRTVVV